MVFTWSERRSDRSRRQLLRVNTRATGRADNRSDDRLV